MSVQNAIQFLWYCNTAAGFALILRLFTTGLAGSYRSLLYYILADGTEEILGVWFKSSGNWSAIIYFIGQTAKLFLAIVIALEMYWDGLAGHPALARFGQRMVGYALLAATAVAFAGLAIDPAVPAGQSKLVHYYFVFERTIDWVVLILLLLLFGFMSWFPVRVRKNFAVYIAVFIVFFFAHPLGLLALNFWPHLLDPVRVGQLAVSLLCVLTLTLFLRREGEVEITVTGHRWDPAAMEKLAGDLIAINARMERMNR